jgi:transposase InsO family protein
MIDAKGSGDPPARTMALVRSRGVRDPRMAGWFNHRRLLEPIGNIPPAEAEERYYAVKLLWM